MSYQHMFYGLDVSKLQGLYGSKDERLLAEVLEARKEELKNNDGFFEDAISEGSCPDSVTALKGIFAGSLGTYERPAAMYGYVLKILCEHLGSPIGDDVAAVRDHSYASKLVASGPPLPIPYDTSDFPEIGYLTVQEIPGEMQRLDAAPKRARRSLVKSIFSLLSGGAIGRQMSDEEVAMDMEGYRNTLQEALDKGLGVVSFRH
jgi:hypothetical protein